jgi:hypothetical protein
MRSGKQQSRFGGTFLASSKIALGYIQAFCIAKKGIEVHGDNGFLGSSGSIHVQICTDFDETATELCQKDRKVIPAPCPS